MPMVLPFHFEFRNKLAYTLPEGFTVESLPESVETISPFGTLSLSVEEVGSDLLVRSSLSISVMQVAAEDYPAFWSQFAEELHWTRRWDRVVEGEGPDTRWFVGGKINACVNCVDRHVAGQRRNKAALIWEGEPGDRRTWTYFDLYREVNKFGNVLRGLGVNKGDRVAIYMPMVPEAIVAMLACARIGAVHSVVFGGFSAESLRDRINDAKAELLITANGGHRRGNVLPLKEFADNAIRDCPSIRHVVVVSRGEFQTSFEAGRDVW
jgi:acetyl-CoA synthetase